MHCLIEHRVAYQGRQPRHRFAGMVRFEVGRGHWRARDSAVREYARPSDRGLHRDQVRLLQKARKDLFLKLVADFDRVTKHLEASPRFSQHDAEPLQGFEPRFIRQFAWPNPLHAEWGLTPALRSPTLPIR